MHAATKRRARRRRITTWSLAVLASLYFASLWALSFKSTDGFGIGSQPSDPVRHNIECSLGYGGLVIVINGSRTDVIGNYDANMGCQYSSGGPAMWFYTMAMERVAAPYIWLPSIHRPGISLGTYIFIPFWLLVPAPPLTLILYHRWRKRRLPGHCRACGYNLAGLTTPICPECGHATTPATAPKSSTPT